MSSSRQASVLTSLNDICGAKPNINAKYSMNAKQPPVDLVLSRIADYVVNYRIASKSAFEMARYCLLDSMACALNAQHHADCRAMLGPVVPGTSVVGGARVPGTDFVLDPIKAAFDISTSIRWLEHSDTWFGKDGGHPSDSLGAIIAVADYICRGRDSVRQRRKLNVMDVLSALIKVYEIQGQLLVKNDFISHGLDSVGMVSVAASAVVTHMLGGTCDQVVNATSNALLDGVSLRLYRIGHNAGWRKAWAAGDAASRGVLHAFMAVRGEEGYPAVLTTPIWGLADSMMRGNQIVLDQPLNTHIVENVLFKVPYPAHFHTQTASECAFKFHPQVKDRIEEVKSVRIRTHEKTLLSACKTGPLTSAASRDHCLQYVVAIILLYGRLNSEDYQDQTAADPRIDVLRGKMVVTEDKSYTRDFYDIRKMMNTNSMLIEFRDGSTTEEIRIDYPLGHARRRDEGLPLVDAKFQGSLKQSFSPRRQRNISRICGDLASMKTLPFNRFMDLFLKK